MIFIVNFGSAAPRHYRHLDGVGTEFLELSTDGSKEDPHCHTALNDPGTMNRWSVREMLPPPARGRRPAGPLPNRLGESRHGSRSPLGNLKQKTKKKEVCSRQLKRLDGSAV